MRRWAISEAGIGHEAREYEYVLDDSEHEESPDSTSHNKRCESKEL